MIIVTQGHVFAMEISSGEEFYIACDNTGTPLAVFSNNGLLLKQVCVFCTTDLFKLFILLNVNHYLSDSTKYKIINRSKYILYSLCACAGTVHSIWRSLLWFQPRLCAGNWFPWRSLWSSDTTAALWRQRLWYPCWEVGTHSVLFLTHIHALCQP